MRRKSLNDNSSCSRNRSNCRNRDRCCDLVGTSVRPVDSHKHIFRGSTCWCSLSNWLGGLNNNSAWLSSRGSNGSDSDRCGYHISTSMRPEDRDVLIIAGRKRHRGVSGITAGSGLGHWSLNDDGTRLTVRRCNGGQRHRRCDLRCSCVGLENCHVLVISGRNSHGRVCTLISSLYSGSFDNNCARLATLRGSDGSGDLTSEVASTSVRLIYGSIRRTRCRGNRFL